VFLYDFYSLCRTVKLPLKQMSTVNFYCKLHFRLDYLPEIVIWVSRQILIFVETKIRNVISVFLMHRLTERETRGQLT
jgi:hypothetical protein